MMQFMNQIQTYLERALSLRSVLLWLWTRKYTTIKYDQGMYDQGMYDQGSMRQYWKLAMICSNIFKIKSFVYYLSIDCHVTAR